MTAARSSARGDLERLARARGVELAYDGVDGRRHVASDAALVAVLAALGEPVDKPADASAALAARAARRRRAGDAGPLLPPVVVAWGGRMPALRLGGARRAELVGEDGSRTALGLRHGRTAGGRLAGRVGTGHHTLELDGERACHVISAPERLAAPAPAWALFSPTYALVDERPLAAGDLTSLRRAGEFAAGLGAGAMATLPLLAEASTAEGAAPGEQPYSPTSRMFWNEGLLDLEQLPELDPDDRSSLGRSSRCARRSPEGRPLADLAGRASEIAPALERAAQRLLSGRGARRRQFDAFRRANRELDRFCAFRAALEHSRGDRASWPIAWREGRIEATQLPESVLLRHAYAQFATDAQLMDTAEALRRRRCGLLLDLPIGCRRDGYDPWAHHGAYVAGASIGAPPDGFFTNGQDWGFPPPDPERDRVAGYPLLRAVLRHHVRAAHWLRVDHVLGWHRLWWVPAGRSPTEGAYVRYPTEELLAVALVEAAATGTHLVGEDLGTVPKGLGPALSRRGVARMRVAIFDLGAAPRRALRPPAGSAAYVDTHDTATFPAFVSGDDIALRVRLGLLSAAAGRREGAGRRRLVAALRERLVAAGRLLADDEGDLAVLAGVLEELGESAAGLVVCNLEDLIGELDPQNVPGTTGEHANFSRRMARALGEIEQDREVIATLRRLQTARRRARSRRGRGRARVGPRP